MRAHFQKLYGENSMMAMDAIIQEQCLPVAPIGSEERTLLLQMYESNDLDERHLICAKYLGYTEAASVLEAWIFSKRTRKLEQGKA